MGRFADRVLDFRERSAGAADLPIVHRPNEPGKSASFAA
jgi:hypothetical protein